MSASDISRVRCARAWVSVLRAHPRHVLPGHVVRGAALAHRVHPRLEEDLLHVLRDPQRLVQSDGAAPSPRRAAAASAKPRPHGGSGGQRAAIRCPVRDRDSLIWI